MQNVKNKKQTNSATNITHRKLSQLPDLTLVSSGDLNLALIPGSETICS